MIVYPCHKGPNQKFQYNKKTKQIRSKSTYKCLDIKKGRVIQNKCNLHKKTQKWSYKKNRFMVNKKCLDVEGGDCKNGNLIVYPCHKGPNQRLFINTRILYHINFFIIIKRKYSVINHFIYTTLASTSSTIHWYLGFESESTIPLYGV
jgi:hypothetical protein